MSRKYFGTDGIRGRFGDERMNPGFARRLGRAAGCVFSRETEGPLVVVLGRDTRASGPALEEALARGLSASGATVLLLGVAPTPAVALAVRQHGAALGVVVTASHNPADDNGIKFLTGDGGKLTDAQEEAVERMIESDAGTPAGCPGDVRDAPELAFYRERMGAVLPAGALDGWRIVLDTAHGAACETAPAVLAGLGADLILQGNRPDGTNINAGVGSEHPAGVAARVKESGARLGLALDGDGDRIVAVDETGEVLAGDAVLVLLARHALARDALAHKTLVATVQSNLGLDAALRVAGGRVERTEVGDRNVLERMRTGGFTLGGESSGHISFSDISPIGDGLLSALKLLEVMIATGGDNRLSRLKRCYRPFPQATAAVRVTDKPPLDRLHGLAETIRRAEGGLGETGRLLVRYSGTEDKLRLLVEGPDASAVEHWLERLKQAVRDEGIVAGDR